MDRKVILNSDERLAAVLEVNWRVKNRQRDGAKATNFGRRTRQWYESQVDYEQRLLAEDIIEVGADLALVKLIGGEVYWPHDSLYPLYDVVLPSGKRVDNKYSTYTIEECWLADKVKERDERLPPELFALWVGRFPQYQLVGWMSYEELKTDERLQTRWWKDFRKTKRGELMPQPCHKAEVCELHPTEQEALSVISKIRAASGAPDLPEKPDEMERDPSPSGL
ncbi:MAG: hypothetical protein LUO89_11240 [Methanothrix sp.]|nr:hypothetical protein [Methanothrix sp.]